MSTKQSNQGVIRKNLALIEEKIEFGMKSEAILAEFKAQGIEFTKYSFASALARARKWREAKNNKHKLLEVGQISPPPASPPTLDPTNKVEVSLINTRIADLNEDAAQYVTPKRNLFSKTKT